MDIASFFMQQITVIPKNIVQPLGVVALLIFGLDAAIHILTMLRSSKQIVALQSLFQVGSENNIPTWYASALLLLCSLLLICIALVKKQRRDRFSLHWLALGVIFVVLSIDEVAMLHERAGDLLELLPFRYTGWFNFQWVILGIPATLIFVLSYIRFLFSLPPRTGALFLIAGSISIAGYLGMEMIAGHHASIHGDHNNTYYLLTYCEEFLEVLGSLVFLFSLFSYIDLYFRGLEIKIGTTQFKV